MSAARCDPGGVVSDELVQSSRPGCPAPLLQEPGPPLDATVIADLRDISDGDELFVREVLTMYLQQSNEFVTAMRAALRANDTGSFKFAAHALGGSSLQTGAMQVAGICHAIQCSEDATDAALSAALETVELELLRVTIAVAQEGWRVMPQ